MTTAIRSYHDLIAWQKAVALSLKIYQLTAKFPADERFGLISQLRRASVGVPSNIAEGQARLTPGEFRQFLGIARGSLAELDTQLIIAEQLGYLTTPCPLFEQLAEVGRMLSGLLSSLRTDN